MKFQSAPVRRVLSAASVLGLAVLLYAQNATRFVAEPLGSKVKLEGTSTIHDWTVESAVIAGAMELGFDPAHGPVLKPGKVTGKLHAYLDGVDVGSGPGAIGSAPTLGAAVGGNSPDGEGFLGLIDSMRVFRVARTAAEISATAKP